MKQKVTIKEVAAYANVSPAVVSRILNNDEKLSVSNETRVRVMEAVEQLHYRPNFTAQSLRKKRTNMVGILIVDCTNPFYGQLLRGIQKPLNDAGFVCLVSETREDDRQSMRLIESFCERQVEGLIIASAKEQDPAIQYLESAHVNYVLVTRTSSQSTAPYVVQDVYGGAKMAMNHLFAMQHRRIACIAGHLQSSSGQLLLKGYKDALKEQGICFEEQYLVESDWAAENGYNAMKRLLELPDRPTAVLACNDIVAISAMNAITSAGLKVPDDISVVGYNNIAIAADITPPLTTVNSPVFEMGETAAHMLMQLMEGEKLKNKRVVFDKTELVVRNSTASKCG